MSKDMKIRDAMRVIALHTGRTLREVQDFVDNAWQAKVGWTAAAETQEEIIAKNLQEIFYRETEWRFDFWNLSNEKKAEHVESFKKFSKELWEQKAYEALWDMIKVSHNIISLIEKIND